MGTTDTREANEWGEVIKPIEELITSKIAQPDVENPLEDDGDDDAEETEEE